MSGTLVRRPAISQEYVNVYITEQNGQTFGTTAPEVAFIVGSADPVSGDWKTAAWVNAGALVGTKYARTARIMAGPTGTYVPTAGTTTTVWYRFTDTPEIPARPAGSITWY